MSSAAHDAPTEHRHRLGRGLPPVPEPGQVVEARGATWAVEDVREQRLPRSPADEGDTRIQHVVTLQSLQEDRLGEALCVVWELEVGHTVVPDQGLPELLTPEGFDDPNTLGAVIDAVRWGAVTSADESSFQAPFRSGANIEPYQLEPLRRALGAPRTNLLLADDVGLGKTIEAGLVVQELLLRHRARSVIVVCPPGLALKWQDEMREKFGLEFVVVDSACLAEVRRTHGLAANPFRLFPRVIVSMSWLATPRAQRLLRDLLSEASQRNSARQYAFDILVVDEAHHVAPASPSALGGGRGYALDSQRTRATKALAERCEHRLFLSATPHNGHSESFTALLEMIDNRRFSRGATLDKAALAEVTVRRLKRDTDKGFLARQILTIPFEPDPADERAFTQLEALLAASAKATGRRSTADLVALLLKKRFLSSPWAFACTLRHYEDSATPSRAWAVDDGYYAEVMGSGQPDEEEGATEHPELVALRHTKTTDPLAAASPRQLGELRAWADGYEHRPDARLAALVTWLDSVCRPDGRTWSNERVVIFTEYADTLDWIVGVLSQRGYADVVETISGATPPDERALIRARFTAEPTDDPVRVLVATDAAGEGIDLQAHCYRLVCFDVPFNPSRVEQRIGRIDRYGQRYAPQVRYLAPIDTASTYAADLHFMGYVARKVATIEGDLGAVNPLIDAEIQAHFVGRPATSTTRTDAARQAANEALAGGMTLNASLTQLSRTYTERKAALHLTPFAARRVVDTALSLSHEPTLQELGDERTDAEVFTVPQLGPRWQPALRGLDTRLTPGVPRPVTFDDTAAADRTDIVHVHLGHALLQKSARLLRGSLSGSDARLHRVTAVVCSELPESCVAVVSRLVLVGRGGLRLHEEVVLNGIRLRGNAMAEAKVETLLDGVLDAPRLQLAGPAVRAELARAWNLAGSRLRERLEHAMASRAERRQSEVTARLQARQAADLARAGSIFEAFRRNLRKSLEQVKSAHALQEAMLFTDDQQRQRAQDILAMERRLLSLGDEQEREFAGIRERYADVRPFVSAAAVVFALTPADAAAMGGQS